MKSARKQREAGSKTMGTQLEFTDSCVKIQIKDCTPGTQLINPCTCNSYFECDTNFNIVNRTCAAGTLYDHITNGCNTAINVEVKGICRTHEPWLQCLNETGADIRMLAQKCGGSYVSSTTQAMTPPQGEGSDGGTNTGLIVGVVVACTLLVVVLAIVVYYWYKRQKKAPKKLRDHQDSINNPSYFNKIERIDSVYAQIDDNMNNPVYNTNSLASTRPPLPGNRPSTQSPTGGDVNSLDSNDKDKTLDLDIAYVEPSVSVNTPKVSRTSETMDSSHGSVYSEVLDPEPTFNDISTPYDNSWQS
ncbi:uncharacterized protein LOC132552607 [Ylistrum balloti]|uniref:uncharacterized protein LOC132552607 n=1 Tax=Ylistrum balloti TaxID=509963 RepID=UPI00290591C0|nr:uncharacterized protein LOC132552607 [Ylistrum balloti]